MDYYGVPDGEDLNMEYHVSRHRCTWLNNAGQLVLRNQKFAIDKQREEDRQARLAQNALNKAKRAANRAKKQSALLYCSSDLCATPSTVGTWKTDAWTQCPGCVSTPLAARKYCQSTPGCTQAYLRHSTACMRRKEGHSA